MTKEVSLSRVEDALNVRFLQIAAKAMSDLNVTTNLFIGESQPSLAVTLVPGRVSAAP
jgi:hypothetical protein